MSTKYKVAVCFGLAHGLNDFVAGYLLAHLSVQSKNWQMNTLAFLVYSVIAFGGQLPAGMLLDKVRHLRQFSLLSIVCMGLAVGIAPLNIWFAIFFSSIASALVHVCGGAACYLSDRKSTTLGGLFTSPGVLGLIAGGIIGSAPIAITYLLILFLPLLLLLIWVRTLALPEYKTTSFSAEATWLDKHDFFMLLLLVAIAFRSLCWNILHMMCYNSTGWLWGLGIAAALGKLIGGYLTDKVDWKRFVFAGMVCAVVLLNVGRDSLLLFCAGIACLQSAVPITLLLMQNYLRESPATASGLSLGVAILFAGLPTYLDRFREMQSHSAFLVLIFLLFMASNSLVLMSRARMR